MLRDSVGIHVRHNRLGREEVVEDTENIHLDLMNNGLGYEGDPLVFKLVSPHPDVIYHSS